MFKKIKRIKKLFILIIIVFFLIFLFSRNWVFSDRELSYGVTFSARQAETLGLDPRDMFIQILDDLGVKKMRLSAYWDEIEKVPGKYDWGELDWQIEEAGARGVEIILAVGGRLPRWPECHFPSWTRELKEEDRQKKIIVYINKTVKRYQGQANIVAWQVENEPFLNHFGNCPDPDKVFLEQEITLVRSLDSRPIVLTDSGELSIWVPAARRADIFGTTMYRDTYSDKLKRYIHYPIKPGFFRFKRNLTGLFANPKKWLVIELQAEPWGPESYHLLSKEERDRTMNLEKFREIIEFSQATGFREFYLWGVEWWFWEREANNDDSLWREAKTLFQNKM